MPLPTAPTAQHTITFSPFNSNDKWWDGRYTEEVHHSSLKTLMDDLDRHTKVQNTRAMMHTLGLIMQHAAALHDYYQMDRPEAIERALDLARGTQRRVSLVQVAGMHYVRPHQKDDELLATHIATVWPDGTVDGL